MARMLVRAHCSQKYRGTPFSTEHTQVSGGCAAVLPQPEQSVFSVFSSSTF
jgi:hypothetical protein